MPRKPDPSRADRPVAVGEDLYYWTTKNRDPEPEDEFIDSKNPLDGFRWLQERVNRAVRRRSEDI